jgi:hypothetical protein
MLPTAILKIIFSYCDDSFFDNVLKERNEILMNFLTDLGLHKELYLHNGSDNYCCLLSYKNICRYTTNIFIKRYIFDYNRLDKYTILNSNITQIIPYNSTKFKFQYTACCTYRNKIYDDTNIDLSYKCDYDEFVSSNKSPSYFFYNDSDNSIKTLSCDIVKISLPIHNDDSATGVNVYSFALFPEKHQPSGHYCNWSKFEWCYSCTVFCK